MEYLGTYKDDAAIFREFVAYMYLAQTKWMDAAEHALYVAASPLGLRQCRFLASLYRVAALAAQETLGLVGTNRSSQSARSPSVESPVSSPTRTRPQRERPQRPTASRPEKDNQKSWTMGRPMQSPSKKASMHPGGEILVFHGRSSSLLNIGDVLAATNSSSWNLLQQSLQTLQPLENEKLAKRRADIYLKQSVGPVSGLWLLAPETVYLLRREEAYSDQVNHLEMLRLLDIGAMALSAEMTSISEFAIVGELISRLVSSSQSLIPSGQLDESPLGDLDLRFEVPNVFDMTGPHDAIIPLFACIAGFHTQAFCAECFF